MDKVDKIVKALEDALSIWYRMDACNALDCIVCQQTKVIHTEIVEALSVARQMKEDNE